MKRHELKTDPEYFSAVADGTKTFEYRLNDRGFEVGDNLVLKEYKTTALGIGGFGGYYTGKEMVVKVTYILAYRFGLSDFVIMSIIKSDE